MRQFREQRKICLVTSPADDTVYQDDDYTVFNRANQIMTPEILQINDKETVTGYKYKQLGFMRCITVALGSLSWCKVCLHMCLFVCVCVGAFVAATRSQIPLPTDE